MNVAIPIMQIYAAVAAPAVIVIVAFALMDRFR